MDKVAQAARNAYYADWRRKNPDKVKAAQDKYWSKSGKSCKWQKEYKIPMMYTRLHEELNREKWTERLQNVHKITIKICEISKIV